MENNLSVEYIRWFYKPLKCKNITPTVEPFSGYDTVRIETKYQEFCNGLNLGDCKLEVREGLYEIDFSTRLCTPIYWNCDRIPKVSRSIFWRSAIVQRGLWFRTDNWQPIDEAESKALEDVYINEILKLPNLLVPKNEKNDVIASLNINNRYYRFLKNGDVYLDTNAAAHYFRKKYSMIDGILLSRGYNKLATKDDQPSDVSHLVFIAHGIGQTLGSITWDCIRLRETCSRLKKKYFTKYKGRLEFLPIEWRTNLPLNEGIIRSVTITDCQPLRAYLNSTALDIMYYTSSIQRMEIMRAFHHEVVRLYSLFCARNPHFTERGGKVSIMAHSLGAVVAFDVLTTSTPMYSDMAYICMLQKMNNEFNENCDLISHHTRLTEIERKLLNRTESQKDVPELPSTASFPEAYRLEPLILRHYTNIQPAVIGNPKLLKVPDLPKSPPVRPMEDSFGFIEKQPNNKQKAKFSKLQARTNSSSSVPKSLGLALNALANYLKKSHPPGIASLFDTWEEPADGMKMMPSPSERHLRARIDFQLEAEELTVQNLLMHVFTSHGGYWTNEALCLFLLSQIFGEAPKFTSP